MSLWFWALSATIANAADAEQSVVFDLLMDGAVVGHRDVSVRYLAPETPQGKETRILETFTEMDVEIGGWGFALTNRSTGMASASKSSFTSSLSTNGKVSEIQARRRGDGSWEGTAHYADGIQAIALRRTEVDLSTLDLLDPGRSMLLRDGVRLRVLSAETGQVMTGVLKDLGEDTLTVGDREVVVHRWLWNPPEATFELAWAESGLLVDWSATFRGKRLDADIRALPVERTYGELQTEEFVELPSVSEEAL
ncbi:MAG: hypothetical protein AAFV53_23220 [Myxococcota bacterium]